MPPAENLASPIGAYDFGGGETSCGAAGFCASVGGYGSIAGDGVLVVPINDGVPAPAVQVALPANAADTGWGELASISCWGADSCVSVGSYEASVAGSIDASTPNVSTWVNDGEGLVVPIANGQVGTAAELTLPSNAAADSTGKQDAALNGVSCDPNGACVAVGSYVDTSGNIEAMIVPIAGGTAGAAVEVTAPSTVADATGSQDASLNSVSCEASGACVAVGDYVDGAGNKQAMVVPVSSAGALGTSTALTLPSDASSTPNAHLDTVSCPASGNCAAIGRYDGTSSNEPMVSSISAAGAALPAAQVVVTLGNAAADPQVHANDVGCGVAGCDVVGSFVDTNDSKQPLVVPISGGASTVLGSEVQVTLPGDAMQDGTGDQSAWLSHISCSAAGSCLASGGYTGDYQGLNYGGLDPAYDNLNALLVGISGTSVDTGISAPLPSDADPYGRLSIGWGVGCGASGSCAVFAKYLQGFTTTAQLVNALACVSGFYGEGIDGNCLSSGSEQPYVISAQAPLTITPGSVPTTVTAGMTSISLSSLASGGWGPYMWSVANGNTLPAGLSLDPFTGEISGTPQVPGTYHLWVRADSPGVPQQNAEASLTLTVSAASTVSSAVVSPAVVSHRVPSLIVVRGNLREHAGKVNVHLRCHSWGRCTGTVKLSWHGHVISKTSRLSIPAGQTRWVTVHLNATGMKDVAGLRKPRHGYPTMNVRILPKLNVGRGIPNGRPMWVL